MNQLSFTTKMRLFENLLSHVANIFIPTINDDTRPAAQIEEQSNDRTIANRNENQKQLALNSGRSQRFAYFKKVLRPENNTSQQNSQISGSGDGRK
jgi:hypothetical protein